MRGLRSCLPRILALALLAWPVAPAAAQSPRPAMQVQFVLEGTAFDQLDAAHKTAIAEAVAGKVVENAQRRWGFLEWTHEAPAEAAGTRWIVRLESEPKSLTLEDGSVFEDSIVRLNHYTVLDGKAFRLHQPEPRQVLYDFGAPKPLQSHEQLRADLMVKLDEQLDPLLQSLDVETALRKIPVTKTLIVDPQHKRIVVPLRLREDLRAEEESVFRVGLVSGESENARFKLKEAGKVPETGEQHGYIVGKVISWDVGDPPGSVPASWIDDLPALVESVDQVVVFMFVYNPSLSGATAAIDGVILDPDL